MFRGVTPWSQGHVWMRVVRLREIVSSHNPLSSANVGSAWHGRKEGKCTYNGREHASREAACEARPLSIVCACGLLHTSFKTSLNAFLTQITYLWCHNYFWRPQWGFLKHCSYPCRYNIYNKEPKVWKSSSIYYQIAIIFIHLFSISYHIFSGCLLAL